MPRSWSGKAKSSNAARRVPTWTYYGLSKTKLPKTKQANKIMKDTASKSNKVLGMQQAGELTQKTANGIRNIIRTNGAQKMAAEAGKTKDLLNLGLGKLSDGTVNAIYGD